MNRLEFIKSVGVGATAVVVAPAVAVGAATPMESVKNSLEDKINRLYPNIIEVMEPGISNGIPREDEAVGTFHMLTEILDNKAEQYLDTYWGEEYKHKTIKTPVYSIIFRRSIKISKRSNLEEEKQTERKEFYRDIQEYINKKIAKDIEFNQSITNG